MGLHCKPRICGDARGDVATLGIQDGDVHQQRTQLQEIQVVAYHRGQVLVIRAVAVAIQIGRIVPTLAIANGVPLQLLWDPVGTVDACEVPGTCGI